MWPQVQDKLREFVTDPIGTAVEWGVYLIMLAVGVAILVWMAKAAVGIVW